MDNDYQYTIPEPIRPDYSGKKRSPFADSDYVTPFDGAEHSTVQQVPVQPELPRKKQYAGRRLVAGLLALGLMITGCAVTALVVNEKWSSQMALYEQAMSNKLGVLQDQIDQLESTGVGQAPSVGELMTPGQVYARNVQAVVAIASQGITTNIYGQVSETASSGTGFLISENGYVVTNYHVVEGATTLTVLTYDGKPYTAKLVGYEAANDICLLKIQAEGMPFVTLGSSDRLAVGDQVAAIGNPLGELTSTLTVGYISAKDRIVSTEGTAMNMLQTDVAINAGNSGGPLFNMKGEVVGITTAKYSGTTSSGVTIEGISFAIPVDDVAGMIDDLQKHGYVTGAYLGVSVIEVSATAQMYGLPAGASVQKLVPNAAAARAGVQVQDIIVDLGGYEVTCLSDLTRALRKFKAGDTTTITVYRGGKNVYLSITLDEKPDDTQNTAPEDSNTPGWNWEDFFDSIFG